MAAAEQLITAKLDVWSSVIKAKSAAGRGKNNKLELYGIKKLRELILDLAVRGLLVPQEPNDEPANELLKRIAAEKAQLVKEKKIKKPKILPAIEDDEKPANLPKGWAYCRLGDAIRVINGRAYKKHEMLSEGTPLLRVGNLFTSNEWYYSDLELEPDKYIDTGDLIYAWSASFGPFIWDGGKAIYHYHIWKLDFYDSESLYKYYVLHYLQAITGAIKASGHGIAMLHMTKERMEKLVVPVPPIAEQIRIAAKVDELMALCDQLEQHQETSITAHQALVQTLLDSLTTASERDGFTAAWARIADHFDTLFTTEWSIDRLQQTILQLAVMGKLVPQNPNDEPAKELLKKIAAEKAQLVKEGKIKKQKALPAIEEDEKPFELPDEWAWVRLAELLPEFQNGASSRGDKKGEEIIVIRLADVDDYRVSLVDPRILTISSASIHKYDLQKDDILIIRVNGSADIVGRFVLCDQDFDAIYCDHFIRMRFPLKLLQPGYLGLLGSSKLIRDRVEDLFVSTAGQKTVNQKHIGSLLVSVPPIEEQHHIVAKVDELMALCGTLKTRINTAQTTQLHLADAMAEQSFA